MRRDTPHLPVEAMSDLLKGEHWSMKQELTIEGLKP